MAVRSIVTFVEPATVDEDPAALSLALEWAKALDARVMVLAFPVDVSRPGASDRGTGSYAKARSRIAALAERAGVPLTVLDRSSFAYGIGEVFADHMKVADLGILTGRRGPLLGERLLAQAALFDSGRPLVIAPSKAACQRTAPRPDCLGRHPCRRPRDAGRALAPLPQGAEAIVARVTDDKEMRMDQSGSKRPRSPCAPWHEGQLPRDARGTRCLRRDHRAAQETGCDLIVAGAVRHSPVHELIFGSVTGRVLDGEM